MKKMIVLLLMLLFVSGCCCTSSTYTSSINSRSSITKSSNCKEYKIDEDVLNNLGITYMQVVNEYGNYTNKIYFEGNYFYYFDKANRAYYFGTDGVELPLSNSLCIGIYTNAQYLFLNMDNEISIDDLCLKYSLTLLGEPEKSVEYDDTYYSFFNLGKYRIWIQSSSPKMICRNSIVYIEKPVDTPQS